jgi:hypothetical protein
MIRPVLWRVQDRSQQSDEDAEQPGDMVSNCVDVPTLP